MTGPRTDRPNTAHWSDGDLDAYTAGLVAGEAARKLPDAPSSGADLPSDAWEWGYHDGYHDIDPTTDA